MPIIYLSPSTQEFNPYVNGGNEELYMNLLADDMIPYLRASGIRYVRNTPDMTAASSIAQSNQGEFDVHLALHSNAAPPELAGQLQGSLVFYAEGSYWGQTLAEILAEQLRKIYPYPQLVKAVPTTTLGEVTKTYAPSALIEFAYHDNEEDAQWIRNNLQAIARAVVKGLTQYFGLPFISPEPERKGVVQLRWGYLNIRDRPCLDAKVVGRAYSGQQVRIWGQWQDWYVVQIGDVLGYAAKQYIREV